MTGNNQQRTVSRFLSHLISIVKRNPYASRAIEFILNNPLYRGVLILGSGTAVAQLIGLVTMPIITRLYLPSEMGILAVYSSVLAIFGVGAVLRYELAYSLPEENDDAINLFGLCLILLCITTIGFALILLFGRDLLVNAFDLGVIEQYIWFLLIGFFGMGLYTMLNYWAVRQRDYKRITYTKINQGAGGSVCKILLGVLSFGPVGLIIGHIVSQIAGITTLARAMWRKDRENFKAISWSRMKSIAKTYKSFPAFDLPASIVNTISLQLPVFMLLAIYDADIVGYYALAHTLMILPSSLISGSMGQAYLGEASKMVREGSRRIKSFYAKTIKHLSLIAIPLIAIPTLCAPFIVPLIFGEVWADAGWYCLPLSLSSIPSFIVSPTSTWHLFNCQHLRLIINIVRVIGIFIAFYVGFLFGLPILITLTLFSVVVLIIYMLTVVLIFNAISKYELRLN